MIDRNHPAVEAGAEGMEYPHIPTAHDAITAALPHLESATEENLARLRNTPAGRELMAEAWQEGAMDHAAATSRMTPETRHIINELMKAANPYLERNA